jgi:hypothetical protein
MNDWLKISGILLIIILTPIGLAWLWSYGDALQASLGSPIMAAGIIASATILVAVIALSMAIGWCYLLNYLEERH